MSLFIEYKDSDNKNKLVKFNGKLVYPKLIGKNKINVYNTKCATALPEDIIDRKIAYNSSGKVIGTNKNKGIGYPIEVYTGDLLLQYLKKENLYKSYIFYGNSTAYNYGSLYVVSIQDNEYIFREYAPD